MAIVMAPFRSCAICGAEWVEGAEHPKGFEGTTSYICPVAVLMREMDQARADVAALRGKDINNVQTRTKLEQRATEAERRLVSAELNNNNLRNMLTVAHDETAKSRKRADEAEAREAELGKLAEFRFVSIRQLNEQLESSQKATAEAMWRTKEAEEREAALFKVLEAVRARAARQEAQNEKLLTAVENLTTAVINMVNAKTAHTENSIRNKLRDWVRTWREINLA